MKQHILEIFQEDSYPSAFPNTSKVVLLFHEIEGVDCAFFGMYVQELDSLLIRCLAMVRRASKENIVAELTDVYDISLSLLENARQRLDGDYLPGAAEDTINQFRQEEDGRKLQKIGNTKKNLSQTDLSTNASKAVLLMQKVIYSPSAATDVLTMAFLYFPNGFQYVLHANLVIMGYSRGNVRCSVWVLEK